MAFAKGQSGNPGGRSTEKPFRDALRMELASADNLRDLRAIARRLIANAAGGDNQAIRDIADRLDGKPVAAVEHSGDPDNPLVHEIRRTIVDPNTGHSGS